MGAVATLTYSEPGPASFHLLMMALAFSIKDFATSLKDSFLGLGVEVVEEE